MLLKFTILCVLSYAAAEKVRYDDYALYKVTPTTEEHVEFLKDLYGNSEYLDFWVPPTRAGEYVSVVSPPEFRDEFEHSLAKRSIRSELMQQNIQEAFDAQLYSRKKRDTRRELFWTAYQTLDEIYEWFEYLAEAYSFVTVVHGGQTHEGRNITGVKISRRTSERSFFVEGGQIGADWLSPTIVTYLIDQLVRGEDPEARAASEEFEWHIFPIVNPDGFEFSQDSVRLWVKNRRPVTSTAIGVDLTKNWNSQWGVNGGSFNPPANNYIGLGPFSEVETRTLSNYIERIGSSLSGFLSFRGFGQRVILPFAHTADHMYNYDEMVIAGRRALGSLAVRYNTQYLLGNSVEVFDGATGIAADWAKHRFNPPVVATYQLRDNGVWGYTLPVNQVLPSCEETYDSVMALIREAKFIDLL